MSQQEEFHFHHSNEGKRGRTRPSNHDKEDLTHLNPDIHGPSSSSLRSIPRNPNGQDPQTYFNGHYSVHEARTHDPFVDEHNLPTHTPRSQAADPVNDGPTHGHTWPNINQHYSPSSDRYDDSFSSSFLEDHNNPALQEIPMWEPRPMMTRPGTYGGLPPIPSDTPMVDVESNVRSRDGNWMQTARTWGGSVLEGVGAIGTCMFRVLAQIVQAVIVVMKKLFRRD